MNRYIATVVYLISTVVVAVPGMSDILVLSDRAAFDAVVADQVTMTFNGLAPAGGFADVSSPYTENGITLYNENGFYALNGAPWGQGFAPGQELMMGNGGMDSYTTVIPAGKTAVGVDLYHCHDPARSEIVRVNVTFSDTSTRYFEVDFTGIPQTEPIFLGLASTNPAITVSEIRFLAEYPSDATIYLTAVFDNLTFGTTIPEPNSCILLSVGLVGLLAYAWRKRK